MAKSRRPSSPKKSGSSLFWVYKRGGRPVRFDVANKDWDWIAQEGDKRWKTRAEWEMENQENQGTGAA